VATPERTRRLAGVPDFDPETLRTVLRRFATGVAVVTTWDGDHPWGTTVNSFSSVSLRPPLILVAFDRNRRIVPALRRTGRYAVNILGEGQRVLSDCFAGGPAPRDRATADTAGAADERDHLCGAEWRQGETGLPILVDAIATLECTLVDIHPAGDHDLYLARVDSSTAAGSEPMPLLYYEGRYLRIERAVSLELEGKAER
jgi:3-hydroxy-9,10-secoandrosta-1,3,5(10)-triene-9,17-dione monooxygenase reductase component